MPSQAAVPSARKRPSPYRSPSQAPSKVQSKTLQRSAFKTPSAPARSLSGQALRSTRSKPALRQIKSRPSLRELFFDDIPPNDAVISNETADPPEERDPHDLSFSPSHVTRASIVDNMLLSLDQYLTGVLNMNDSPSPRSSPFIEQPSLRNPNPHSLKSAPAQPHTLSSIPSHYDIPHDDDDDDSMLQYPRWSPPSQISQGWTSSPQSLHRLSNRGWEDDPFTRNRVYEAQRATLPGERVQMSPTRMGRNYSKSSGSSSVDLGQRMHAGTRIALVGTHPSPSIERGPNNHEIPPEESILPLDAPPTSNLRTGRDQASSPPRRRIAGSLTYHEGPIVRSPSRRSPPTQYTRNRRSDTPTGHSFIEGGIEDIHEASLGLNVVHGGRAYVHSPRHRPKTPVHRLSFNSSLDSLRTARERPGFFRRVFGVSNEKVSANDRPLPLTSQSRIQKPGLKDSTMVHVPASKESHPTVTRKSSAFFRRRKKSVSDMSAPPAMPSMHDGLKIDMTQASEPGSISSLRKFMDPYIADARSFPLALPSPRLGMSRRGSTPGFRTAHPSLPHTGELSETDDSRPRPFLGDLEPKAGAGQLPHPAFPDRIHQPRPKVPDDRYDAYFLANESGAETPLQNSTYHTIHPALERPKTSPTRFTPYQTTSFPHGTETLPSLLFPARSGATALNLPSHAANTNRSWQRSEVEGEESLSPQIHGAHAGSALPSNQGDRDSGDIPAESTPVERRSPELPPPLEGIKESLEVSGSESSVHEAELTMAGTPQQDEHPTSELPSPTLNAGSPFISDLTLLGDEQAQERALKIFENRDEGLDPADAAAWLGDSGPARQRIRKAYMGLFDWTNIDLLVALRGLCARIALKGETQQVDRMLDAFAKRWCECNVNHAFRTSDVVHTICYSILLLNTDLHVAEIGQRMTKGQFVRNTLPTIRRVASIAALEELERSKHHHCLEALPVPSPPERNPSWTSLEETPTHNLQVKPSDDALRDRIGEIECDASDSGPAVGVPLAGSQRRWELHIEASLKSFYTSISKKRLPLFGSGTGLGELPPSASNLLNLTGSMLRRTPSTLSKANSESVSGRHLEPRLGTARWTSRTRSRPRLYPISTVGLSRTSLEEQSSAWSPSISSTWSRASPGKTLTSMSVDSFNPEVNRANYQRSIGFANALSQAIIREDNLESGFDEGLKEAPLIEDESLELSGAPWAKEGILKHKHHLESPDKKAKERNWNDCFGVIEKGWLRVFSFSVNAKSLRQKAKAQKAGGVVGGGNWMDSAEEMWKFMLRHTIASALPAPGYSKNRPYVWALSLPTGAVHLFSAGTPEIVQEFVSTVNYWSARLSKEPMVGGISNMEYGWSDMVVNKALIGNDSNPDPDSEIGGPRYSMHGSVRSSFENQGWGTKPTPPGDKVHINEWTSPQQSMMASQLMEVDQLKALQVYVKNVEEDLQKHNQFRSAMLVAFSQRHPNSSKAMTNWERKSSYLLKEIVKYQTYIDTLQSAQVHKEKIYEARKPSGSTREHQDETSSITIS